jgi:hypothetical protein
MDRPVPPLWPFPSDPDSEIDPDIDRVPAGPAGFGALPRAGP